MKRFRCMLAAVLMVAAGAGDVLAQSRPSHFQKEWADEEKAPSRQGLRVVPRPGHERFSVRIHTPRRSYRVGDSVRVNFRSTRDAYVYIYSTDARGRTRQIFPNYYDRDNFAQGGISYSIPDSGYDLVAEPPLGPETLSIVAVRGKYRVPERFRTFSESEPFPRASGGRQAVRAVVPREKRAQLVAEDSTTIYITGRASYRY